MAVVLGDIGALLAGVVNLYGGLHSSLKALFVVSFVGWVFLYPILRLIRGVVSGFY